jgi:hypothetical protein
MAARQTPFALVFGAIAPARFPVLRDAVAASGRDPREREGFLLLRQSAELLYELRPEEGLGEAVQALAALLHHAYLFWVHGEILQVVSDSKLATLVATPGPRSQRVPTSRPLDFPTSRLLDVPTSRPPDVPTRYVQLAALRVWGAAVEDRPPEPLDGWFVSRSADQLTLLAIFGLNPARGGLTAVEVSGPRPAVSQRLDGSPLFAPVLAGGAAAGLASVLGEAELLELAWRAEEGL